MDATVAIDGANAANLGQGIYSATITTWSPTPELTLTILETGFTPLTPSKSQIHILNTLLYLTITAIVIGTTGIAKRRAKPTPAPSSPQ